MKKNKWLIYSLALCCALSTAGCKEKKEETAATGDIEVEFPLSEQVELTYWSPLDASVSAVNYGETTLYKKMEEVTNVKMKFMHPARGQEQEQLNILIASNELPDIMEGSWATFPGGPIKALNDKIIVSLNDYMDKYAPNLKSVLASNETFDKLVKTDDSRYYCFPFLREDDILCVYGGPVVRKDWLDELGLEAPETIEEWEIVLTAFKEKKGATAPFTFDINKMLRYKAFIGAFGVTAACHQEDGKIVYGPIQPGYKEFLTTMNRWYENELIDPDFATLDTKTIDAKMTNGKAGATVGASGGSLGKYLQAMATENPTYDLMGVVYPTVNKGEIAKFGQRDLPFNDYGSASVTYSSKNKEIAIKWLDYAYSPEGSMLFNFGVEGESYTMENGYPTYTEDITKNSKGLSMSAALADYTRVSYNGPFVQDKRYIDQFYQLQQSKDAMNAWTKTEDAKYAIGTMMYTSEESAKMSKIMSEINTFVEEMRLKFIMGIESLDNFDKYVDQLKQLGVDEYISIQQAAYDRYKNR